MFLTVTYSAVTVGLLLPVCAVLVTYLPEWPWQLQLCFCIYALCLLPRMDFTQCVPKAARKVHPGHLCCTGWWLFFFYNCASRSTWTFSFFFTSSSSIMRVPRWGFYTVTPCLLLFSLLAFVSVLSAILQPSPTPTQLYVCDSLYRHLVHIEDCHCHLLIITVTCTLRSAINT